MVSQRRRQRIMSKKNADLRIPNRALNFSLLLELTIHAQYTLNNYLTTIPDPLMFTVYQVSS